MIHIRIDHDPLNDNRRFACGIGPALPSGDQYYFESESYHRVDCPGCLAHYGCTLESVKLGTPISQLSGRPGTAGFAEFTRIADSWGYP